MSRRDFFEQQKMKKMVTTSAIAIGLAIVACVTIFVMYSQKLNKDAEANLFAAIEENENIVSNEDLTETSFSNDKTVSDSNNSIRVELENNTNSLQNTSQNTAKSPESKEAVSPVVKEEEKKEEKAEEVNETEEENQEEDQTMPEVTEDVELCFQAPVAGEIIKDYAMDTLIYSKTLDEWCTHSGIDIKADKASVVASSEAGIVESIKNDPRYGLTIVISHPNGFKTVYSNLLTTEFVQEGEEVEKGQTIATVGETASFEIADETHLHFEMYKDEELVNPTIYFK